MPNKIRRYETVIQKGWPFSNVTKFGQRVKSLPYLYCVEKFRLTLEKVVLLIAENSINLSYRKAEKPRNTVFVRLWDTLLPVFLCIIPLLLITAIVPLVCYNKMAQKTVVERLRIAE